MVRNPIQIQQKCLGRILKSKFQFEEEVPESPWGAKEETSLMSQLERNQRALAISGKSGQNDRTAYQETPPASNLETTQLVGSRDRVFAILSPVARRVAVQEVGLVENYNVLKGLKTRHQ